LLSADETAINYQVIVANIDNVVASHIHLGPAGANGPVVAFRRPVQPGRGSDQRDPWAGDDHRGKLGRAIDGGQHRFAGIPDEGRNDLCQRAHKRRRSTG
jgi:hypothetical protein